MLTQWMVRARQLACLALCVAVLPLAQGADERPALGLVSRHVPDATDWRVRVPPDDKVAYRGTVSFDKAGIGGMGMLYPAPNLVGFFAAVLTHGLIADSAQEKKKAQLREEADKVLLPYQPVLEKITHRTLVEQAMVSTTRGASKKLLGADEGAPGAWIIEMVPVFSMTQDERALVLDNAVVVRSPEAPSVVFYQNVVRVVSYPRPALGETTTMQTIWSADDGRMIRQESALLLAESVDVVLAELAKGPDTAELVQKTIRYPEGGAEKMERAALVVERCNRVVLKTLRGWLMSVPRQADSSAACEGERSAGASPRQ